MMCTYKFLVGDNLITELFKLKSIDFSLVKFTWLYLIKIRANYKENKNMLMQRKINYNSFINVYIERHRSESYYIKLDLWKKIYTLYI